MRQPNQIERIESALRSHMIVTHFANSQHRQRTHLKAHTYQSFHTTYASIRANFLDSAALTFYFESLLLLKAP